MKSTARLEFTARCEKVALQLTLNVMRLERATPAELAPFEARLALVGVALEDLERAPREERPMRRLAEQLRMTPADVEFMWAVVAVAVMPGLPDRPPVGDTLGRGLSPDTFVRARLLSHLDKAIEFTLDVRESAPVIAGLLRLGEDFGTRTAYRPATALVLYLSTDEDALYGIDARFRRVLDPGTSFVVDDAQAEAILQLQAVRCCGAIIFVEGPDGSGRETAITRTTGRPVYALDLAGCLDKSLGDVLLDFRALLTLTIGIPVLRGIELLWSPDRDREVRIATVVEFVERILGAVFAPVCAVTGNLPACRSMRVAWPAPAIATRGRLWSVLALRHGAVVTDDTAASLGQRYPAGPRAIGHALSIARDQTLDATDRPVLGETILAEALRSHVASHVGDLGSVVRVRHEWDDLVLPAPVRERADLVVARVQQAERVFGAWGFGDKLGRGGGTVVLLSGPPGTGKTMLAGLMARTLGYELFAVDHSRIVSKWIGEPTERMARLFDAAETGQFALLIDEAEALFGSRTREITTSTDRHSNQEIDYLLQRLDTFSGVAFLTTNHPAVLDRAMQRRITAHLVLPEPGEAELVLLWKRLLASGRAPISADFDAEDLATRFPQMNGGTIRNAVLAAAFLAASEKADAIAQTHLLRAARLEYEAMGHVPRAPLRTVPPDGR